MKRIISIGIALGVICGAGFAANRDNAIGYDAGLSMVTYRMAMGANKLDVGFGLDYDDTQTEKLAMGASAFYLLPLSGFCSSFQNDDKLRAHVYGGGVFDKDHLKNNNISIGAGFIPEYFIHDRISFETRVGLAVQLTEDMRIQTIGNPVNIVSSLAFKFYLD